MTNQSPDRETRQFLAEIAAAEGPSFDELSIEEKRAGLEAMFLMAESHAPDAKLVDIKIPARDGRSISGYACYPQGKKGPLPILFLIQGGGWAFARAKPYQPLAALLAEETGRLIVCIDFRLAPEHPFPAGLEDCIDTFCWLQKHAGTIGGDASRISLFGDSAGGNLAAAVTLSDENKNYQKAEALVLVYPMIDVTEGADTRYMSRRTFGGGDHFLTQASIDWAADHYVNKQEQLSHPLISLTQNKNLERLPPTTILTAGMDPLRDEAQLFADILKEAGNDVTYRVYDGTIHGFLSFFFRLKIAHRAIAFIKKQLA